MKRAYQKLLALVTVPVIALTAALTIWQYGSERDRLIETLERTAYEQRLLLDNTLKAARDHVALMRNQAERALAGPQRYNDGDVLWPRSYQVVRDVGTMTVASLDHLIGTDQEARVASILGEPEPTLAAGRDVSAAIELFEIMRSAHEANPGFVWSYFFSAGGRFVSIFPFHPAEILLAQEPSNDMQSAVDGWHAIEVLRLGLPEYNPAGVAYWTPAYDDPVGRGRVVSYGMPVHDPDGGFVGIAAVDFEVQRLAGVLNTLRPALGETVLVGEDGQVISGSNIVRDLDEIGDTSLVQRIRLDHAPWMVVTAVPPGSIPRYVLPRLAPYGAILCALLAAVLVAHLLMQRRFIQPSLRLLDHIQAEAEDRADPAPTLPPNWRPWGDLVSSAFGSGRETRRRLEEAEARFLAAVNSIPDGLAIFDSEDRLVFHNRRYPDHLAPSLRQVLKLGERFDDLIRAALAIGPVYHPEMGQDFAEQRLLRRRGGDGEHEHRLVDGRWLRIRENRTLDGGRVLLTSDISAAKRAEIALRESELRYRAVVETQTEFVTRMTPEGRITFCNEAYARHVGLDRETILGPEFSDFAMIVPEDRPAHARHLASLTPDRPAAVIELDARLPDGRVRREEWSDVGVFDAAGRLVEIQAVGRDVTEQRTIAAELARQREALHQSEKLAALGSLLAGVAHELNNPLSIVTGYATMLRDLSTDEATRRRGEMIHTAAERCARIVRSFLAMARSEPRDSAPVAVNELVEAALAMLAYGLRTADVTVESRLARDLPAVMGDADQLHQVVTNLILNAQQAMQTVSTPRRLTIETMRDGDDVVIRFRDTGPGVPEALRARIFDPFFTTKPVGVGTGLGLSVSRGIVLAHRGALDIEDNPGGGAVFRVSLPATNAAAAGAEHAGAAGAVAPAHILVVDDEPDLVAMLVETLESDGHRVATASSGREALIRIGEAEFDVILTDLRMPDLDGVALMRLIRERRPALLHRLVLMTGDVLGTSIESLVSMMDVKPPLIEKPVDTAVLRAVLAEQLATHRIAEETAT